MKLKLRREVSPRRFIGGHEVELPAVVIITRARVPVVFFLVACFAVAATTYVLGPVAGFFTFPALYPFFRRFAVVKWKKNGKRVEVSGLLSVGDLYSILSRLKVRGVEK